MSKIKAHHILVDGTTIEVNPLTDALQQVPGTDGSGGIYTGSGGEIICVDQFVTDGPGTVDGKKYVYLSRTPATPEAVTVTIVGGSEQRNGQAISPFDFNLIIYGVGTKKLTWDSYNMESNLSSAGIHFIVAYQIQLSDPDNASELDIDTFTFDNHLNSPTPGNAQDCFDIIDTHSHTSGEINTPVLTGDGIFDGLENTLDNLLQVTHTHTHLVQDVPVGTFTGRLSSASDTDLSQALIIVDSSVLGNTISITQANSFAPKDVIRFNLTQWVQTKADTYKNATGCWVVVSATPTSFIAQRVGRCYIPAHGYTVGKVLYLSAEMEGLLVETKPVGTTSLPLGFYLPVAYVESSNYIQLLGSGPEYNPVLAQYLHSGSTLSSVDFLNLQYAPHAGEATDSYPSLKFEIASSFSGTGLSSNYGIDLQINSITSLSYTSTAYYDDGASFVANPTTTNNRFVLSSTTSGSLNDTVYVEGTVSRASFSRSLDFRVMAKFINHNNQSGIFVGKLDGGASLRDIENLRFFAGGGSPDFQFMTGQNDYIRILWEPQGI